MSFVQGGSVTNAFSVSSSFPTDFVLFHSIKLGHSFLHSITCAAAEAEELWGDPGKVDCALCPCPREVLGGRCFLLLGNSFFCFKGIGKLTRICVKTSIQVCVAGLGIVGFMDYARRTILRLYQCSLLDVIDLKSRRPSLNAANLVLYAGTSSPLPQLINEMFVFNSAAAFFLIFFCFKDHPRVPC